jgi:hypothetical protein
MENDFKMTGKAVAIVNKMRRPAVLFFAIFTHFVSLLNSGGEPFYTSLKKNMTSVKCSPDTAQKKLNRDVLL